MTSVCKACGFTSEEQDAKFCPNCGGTLESMAYPQSARASTGCPKCGSTANAAGALFCQQCGSSLGGQPAQGQVYPVVTPGAVYPVNVNPRAVYPVNVNPVAVARPYTPSASGSGKSVTGVKIKSMPIARMTENGQEQSGSIELHSDGIIFFGKRMAILASLHVTDIAKASAGAKNNLLDVQMKDGGTKTFKFMNASDWAGIVNQNIK
jgi:hypothetical protein